MCEWALRKTTERRDLFRAVAQAMKVHEAVIEKDFWVVWVLDLLFTDCPWKDRIVFKGGTSLSKVYGAIERFSEDIDLILDWRVLGLAGDEPWTDRSASRQDAFGKELNRKTELFLRNEFVPSIQPVLSEMSAGSVICEAKIQDVYINYPRSFSLGAILPQIRLEIGPMAAWHPNESHQIKSYAAERYHHLFTRPSTTVRVTSCVRSFWEKATILHQEAHRSAEKPLPPRYSRHYYDLFRLSRLPVCDEALSRIDLLQEVVTFKQRFYRCSWARYEAATPGSFRLIPPEAQLGRLQQDYRAMQSMLFGQVPEFDDMIGGLKELERRLNHA